MFLGYLHHVDTLMDHFNQKRDLIEQVVEYHDVATVIDTTIKGVLLDAIDIEEKPHMVIGFMCTHRRKYQPSGTLYHHPHIEEHASDRSSILQKRGSTVGTLEI